MGQKVKGPKYCKTPSRNAALSRNYHIGLAEKMKGEDLKYVERNLEGTKIKGGENFTRENFRE